MSLLEVFLLEVSVLASCRMELSVLALGVSRMFTLLGLTQQVHLRGLWVFTYCEHKTKVVFKVDAGICWGSCAYKSGLHLLQFGVGHSKAVFRCVPMPHSGNTTFSVPGNTNCLSGIS